MAIRFRLLTEADVRSVLTMDDLIETMASALQRFSTGQIEQPVRPVISVDGDHAFFATMPAFARTPDALGAKLVTVFERNHDRGLPSHLASIVLLDPEVGGMDLLDSLLDIDPGLTVLIVTAHYAVESAIEAIRRGAR